MFSARRARMARQSVTATRTDSSTRSIEVRDHLQLARLGHLIDLHMHVRLGDRIGRRRLIRASSTRPTAAIAADAHHRVQQGLDVGSRRLISAVTESTMKGMSSLTTSRTVCSSPHPFFSTDGLKRRTSASRVDAARRIPTA